MAGSIAKPLFNCLRARSGHLIFAFKEISQGRWLSGSIPCFSSIRTEALIPRTHEKAGKVWLPPMNADLPGKLSCTSHNWGVPGSAREWGAIEKTADINFEQHTCISTCTQEFTHMSTHMTHVCMQKAVLGIHAVAYTLSHTHHTQTHVCMYTDTHTYTSKIRF